MSQETDVKLLITQHTEKGKLSLRDGTKESFHNAIKEFVLAYKNALFLNEDRATEHSCLFNIGSAYVAAGYYDRGVDVLKSVDQLIKQRNVTSSSPSQGDILFNIGFAYDQMKKDDIALSYYEKARHEYNSQAPTPLMCETLLNMGKVFERKGEALQARACYSKATTLYTEMNKFPQACETLLAQADLLISTSPVVTYECSEVLSQCQKQALKIDDELAQANIFYKMALKYTLVSDYDNSLYCFEQAEGLSKNKDKTLYANVCQNLGAIHNRLQDYLLAIQYHRKSVKVHGELGNRNAQGQCFCNQAYAEIQLKYFDDAEMSYMHAKQAFRDCDNLYGRWHVYESLAGLSVVRRDFPRAIEHYKRAIKHQANSKELNSDSQDRLIDKLVFAIDQYHRTKGTTKRPAIESTYENPSAITNARAEDETSKLPGIPLNASTTEVDGPPVVSNSGSTKVYRGGRRDYPEDEQGWKPPQVARGLSSVTERSAGSSRSYRKKGSGVSAVSWKLHAKSSDSDSSLEDIIRPSSAYMRAGNRRRRGQGSARHYDSLSTDPKMTSHLSFLEEESSGFPKDEFDTPRSNKSDTDYADHYREQLKSVEQLRASRQRSSSSSSSSSDESTVREELEESIKEVPKSMPRGAPPKPPRSNLSATSDRTGTSEGEAGRVKKNLRFQEQSEESPNDSTHLYASVKTRNSQETTGPIASPVANTEDIYDEPPREDATDSPSEAEAPPLYATYQSQPKDEATPIQSEVTDGPQPVGRQQDDELPSLPRRSPRKNKGSKACIVM